MLSKVVRLDIKENIKPHSWLHTPRWSWSCQALFWLKNWNFRCHLSTDRSPTGRSGRRREPTEWVCQSSKHLFGVRLWRVNEATRLWQFLFKQCFIYYLFYYFFQFNEKTKWYKMKIENWKRKKAKKSNCKSICP